METNRRANKPDRGLAERFAILKQRLLLECLDRTPESETHTLIMLEANEAAGLAWLSSYPLLTFPCLFEERAIAARERVRRQARLYWSNLEAATPARAVWIGWDSRANR